MPATAHPVDVAVARSVAARLGDLAAGADLEAAELEEARRPGDARAVRLEAARAAAAADEAIDRLVVLEVDLLLANA